MKECIATQAGKDANTEGCFGRAVWIAPGRAFESARSRSSFPFVSLEWLTRGRMRCVSGRLARRATGQFFFWLWAWEVKIEGECVNLIAQARPGQVRLAEADDV